MKTPAKQPKTLVEAIRYFSDLELPQSSLPSSAGPMVRFAPPAAHLTLEQLAKRLVHESSWTDGCLFGRSQTQDSRGLTAAAHEQKRGRPRFRGQPLLCQALREGCITRALAVLGKAGTVQTRNRQIYVIDADALEYFAEVER